jgi:hypothetical protein
MGTTSSQAAFLENFKLLCDQEPLTIDDSLWAHLLRNVCSFEDLVTTLPYEDILEIQQTWPHHLQQLLEKSVQFIRRMTKGELHFEIEIVEMSLRVVARLMPVVLSTEDAWMWSEESLALSIVDSLTSAAFTFGFTCQVASQISPYGSP